MLFKIRKILLSEMDKGNFFANGYSIFLNLLKTTHIANLVENKLIKMQGFISELSILSD